MLTDGRTDGRRTTDITRSEKLTLSTLCSGELKMWPLLRWQGFSIFGHSDLDFDLEWPIFKLDLETIKIHVHNNFHDDWVKTVASIAMTRFFYDLTQWPSFWPQMTNIQTWPRSHQDTCTQQFSWWLSKKCDLYCNDKVFLFLAAVT